MNRLFIGTLLKEAERENVQEFVDSNKEFRDKWGKHFRLVAPEKLHITWMFLGECDEVLQNEARDLLKEIAANSQSCVIEYDRMVFWSSNKFPRVGVLIAGHCPAEIEKPVKELKRLLLPKLQNAGDQKSEFKPHITLTRFKSKCVIEEEFIQTQCLPIKQTIKEVSLIRSIPDTYEIVENFRLL